MRITRWAVPRFFIRAAYTKIFPKLIKVCQYNPSLNFDPLLCLNIFLNFCLNCLQDENAPPAVILFSIIALEKFSQTTENKITVQKRLKQIVAHNSSRKSKDAKKGAGAKDINKAKSKSTPKPTGTFQYFTNCC